MSNDLEALARRAVACPAWRWIEGAQDARGFQVLCRSNVDVEVYTGGGEIRRFPWSQWQTEAVPDLADPATLGCMLALVCEAFGEVYLSPEWHEGQRWWVPRRESNDVACGPGGRTKAHALVAALEAAPAKVAP